MLPTYASFRSIPPADFELTAIAGSASNINRNFYISFHNRAGRSLLSDGASIASTGVRVTLNAGLILETEEVFWVVISAETTGNSEDAAILAMWQARDSNQITRRSLPVTIDFTTEEHFRAGRAVTGSNNLPSTGMLNGTIALDVSTGIYYRYDYESYVDPGSRIISYGAITSGVGGWVEYNGNFNAYLASTNDQFGSDRVLFTVSNALKIPPKIGAAVSTQQRYWLNNGLSADGGSPIVTGKYTFDIAVDGVPGYETLFANKIRYYLRGYLNRETLDLNTAIATVGQPKLWNPTDGLIILPTELPRNQAAVYDLELVFNNDDLIGLLPQNSSISLDIVEVPNIQGAVSEIAKVIGNLIFADLDKLLIVPGLKRLSGIASIVTGFMIEDKNEQLITGVLEDTANQQITLSGSLNGLGAVKTAGATLGYAEVLRATVSTEPGISKLVANSNGAVSLSNNAIALTVNHPLTSGGAGIIRSDYPDTLIAGNNKASFTPRYGYVFLAIGSVFYQSSVIQITATAFQVINLDLADFTVIPSLPVQSDSSFGLFAPSALGLVSSGAGSFTGSATAHFAYYYPTPNQIATKIDNESFGAIPTARYTLAEAINRSLARAENLNDLLDKAIARTNLDVYPKVELDTHRNNTSNPHQVTTTQIGAATTTQLAITNNNITASAQAIALNTASRLGLGTAATRNIGTAIDNVIALQNVGGVAKLPSVDGSQLTNIGGQLTVEFVSGTFTAIVSAISPINYLIDTTTAVATVNLPPSPPNKGIVAFSDRRKTFGTNVATIVPGSGHTIDGGTNFLLDANNEAVTLIFDSANTNYSVLEGIQNNSTGAGDMLKSVYDANGSGVVDSAEAIAGTPGNLKFYGTNATGTKGFYDYLVGAAVKAALEALVTPNKLAGSAIANFGVISNSPGDGFAPIYDLGSSTITWQYVNRGIGAGSILLPLSQSLFETPDGVLTAYTPDVGAATYENIKVLTTAATPNNQIVSEQLQINVINTGAVLNLGTSNTVLRVNWIFTTGSTDCLIARYQSNGNMIILELNQGAIALKSIVNDVITTITTQPFTFVDNTSYKIDLQAVGVVFKVLIDDSVAIAEALSNEFLTATKFGIGKLT
jgi:hypothetical protein